MNTKPPSPKRKAQKSDRQPRSLGAASCSLLGDTPVTNAIRARYRGEDNKLAVAMIAHANDMERRLHAIAGSIVCLRDEWVTQQSELFQEFISCIRRNATLTANASDQATARK